MKTEKGIQQKIAEILRNCFFIFLLINEGQSLLHFGVTYRILSLSILNRFFSRTAKQPKTNTE